MGFKYTIWKEEVEEIEDLLNFAWMAAATSHGDLNVWAQCKSEWMTDDDGEQTTLTLTPSGAVGQLTALIFDRFFEHRAAQILIDSGQVEEESPEEESPEPS